MHIIYIYIYSGGQKLRDDIIGEKMAGLKSSIAIGLKSCFREWLRIITP